MGLFGRNHEISSPSGQIWTSCPPGLENSVRNGNPVDPISSDVVVMSVEADAYFQTHGTYPPVISEDATREEIETRIHQMQLHADGIRDNEQASMILHEVGYLTCELTKRIGKF